MAKCIALALVTVVADILLNRSILKNLQTEMCLFQDGDCYRIPPVTTVSKRNTDWQESTPSATANNICD